MTQRRCIATTLLVLVLAMLGCISVEVVSPEETPLRTASPFAQATRTPLRASPTATPSPTTMPSPTSTAAAEPSVSRVFFAEGVSGGSEPVHATTEFRDRTAKVYAFATFSGMPDNLRCQSVWYMDGQERASKLVQWAFGESGETWVDVISEEGGLPSGRYDWELAAEGQLLARGGFVIRVGPQGSPSPQPSSTTASTPFPPSPTPIQPTPTRGPTEFDPIVFAEGLTAERDPIMPRMSFSYGISEVYAVWACRGMHRGLEIVHTWYHDGRECASSTVIREEENERGREHVSLEGSQGAPLPSGNYRLELYVGGYLLQSGTFTIQ
jgi:hypothetical protein